MMRRRGGRPGLIGTMARTAVVAGTATAVSDRMRNRSANNAAQAQQEAAPPPPAAAAPVDRVAMLKELGELKASGVLSDAEFESEKAKILQS